MPTNRPSGDRCKKEIIEKINSEEISARVYSAEEDPNVVVMFTQPKRARHKELRFQSICRPRNAGTIGNYTTLRDIQKAIEFVATRPS